MRILVLSDIHLDHNPDYVLPASFPDHDVAVFAGDVAGTTAEGVRYLACAPQLRGSTVVMVAGNHEFYGEEIASSLAEAQEAAAGTNVVLLDRNAVEIHGKAFVGATLWTDYKLFGKPVAAMEAAALGMNDHRRIRTVRDGRVQGFTPRDALARHMRERAWLAEALSLHGPGSVVVTHHAPHVRSVHKRFLRDPVTPAFASDLTRLIRDHRPSLWIHGHTHDSFDYVVGRTRIVCNPKGYSRETAWGLAHENRRYDEAFVVEVD